MNQREKLLKAAIREFEDFSNEALLVPFERVVNKQGFTYLVLDKAKAKRIHCAIHFNREYVVTEEIGRLHTSTNIDVSTREQLDIQNNLIIYRNQDVKNVNTQGGQEKAKFERKDMFIFAKSFDGYNETMQQYLYSCEALTCDKEGVLHELTDIYGHSSFDIFSELEGHTIIPFYANVEPFVDKCAILRINPDEQETLSLKRVVEKGVYKQLMKDSVQFTLLHYTRAQAMKFLSDLEDFSLNQQKFGFVSTPKISEFEDLQESAGVRGFALKVEFDCCYSLVAYDESADFGPLIKKAYFEMAKVG